MQILIDYVFCGVFKWNFVDQLMSFNTTGLWHLIEWQVVNFIAFKTLIFQDFRRKHIEAELNKFDRAVKSKQEVLKWGWSPLFQVFLKWPLHNYDPGHWDNTEEE